MQGGEAAASLCLGAAVLTTARSCTGTVPLVRLGGPGTGERVYRMLFSARVPHLVDRANVKCACYLANAY